MVRNVRNDWSVAPPRWSADKHDHVMQISPGLQTQGKVRVVHDRAVENLGKPAGMFRRAWGRAPVPVYHMELYGTDWIYRNLLVLPVPT